MLQEAMFPEITGQYFMNLPCGIKKDMQTCTCAIRFKCGVSFTLHFERYTMT
jgi:hypothetical protein